MVKTEGQYVIQYNSISQQLQNHMHGIVETFRLIMLSELMMWLMTLKSAAISLIAKMGHR